MTYLGIDRRRFAQLLEWGADDDELRRFFAETRLQLVRKRSSNYVFPQSA